MILIIDDDSAIRTSLTLLLKHAGHKVKAVSMPREAMEVVRAEEPRLILMDMNFSLSTDGMEGLTLLKQVKLFRPEVPVILMTAWGSIELAVQGMQAGAFDFITKPWQNVLLMQRIETALELNAPKDVQVSTDSESGFDRAGIVGESKALKDIFKTIRRIAPTNAPVLITGESGTGKELIAEAVYCNSLRRNKPYVKVNLGGVSQSLFESEMFGHKKGAFTDATCDRIGRFEMADTGTIFLDELGELDMSCQTKMLRVLQEQTFEVLGDSKPHKVDVRVVCATNANLPEMVQKKTFREDLFYRVNLITIHLPPLRERREDIPLLVHHFAHHLCEKNGLPEVVFSKEALDYLSGLPYPGNIRELKNFVERVLLVCDKPVLDAEDFRCHYQPVPISSESACALAGMTLEEVERQAIVDALDKYDKNLSQVAQVLGITRQSLYRRIEKFGIEL